MNSVNNVLDNNFLVRLGDTLGQFVNTLIDFCQDYLFCLVAIGLWIKILLAAFGGRKVSILMIMLAIACSGIAISIGAFFW